MLAGWKIAGGLALVAASALAWALIERGQGRAYRSERDAARADVARLDAAVAAQALEMRRRRELADAGDRWVVAVERGAGEIRTRIVTVVREIARAADANDPVGPALGLALDRLRAIDAIDRRPGAGGAAGPAGGPPARPRAAADPG
ncbi:MAG: hypothetical protein IT561_27915 [Alphaproteobacteria bacterium]|nr:hypothetical protein [Alphaproteobacteria bacterium]